MGGEVGRSGEFAQVLHEAWLAIHARRFDEHKPDTFYAGILAAERELTRVAESHGIDYHAVRNPSVEHLGCARRIEYGLIRYACGIDVPFGTPDAYAEHVRLLADSRTTGATDV